MSKTNLTKENNKKILETRLQMNPNLENKKIHYFPSKNNYYNNRQILQLNNSLSLRTFLSNFNSNNILSSLKRNSSIINPRQKKMNKNSNQNKPSIIKESDSHQIKKIRKKNIEGNKMTICSYKNNILKNSIEKDRIHHYQPNTNKPDALVLNIKRKTKHDYINQNIKPINKTSNNIVNNSNYIINTTNININRNNNMSKDNRKAWREKFIKNFGISEMNIKMPSTANRTKFEFTDEEKPPIRIKVKTILGKEAQYQIKCIEDISVLKASVHKSFDLSPKRQCLVYKGKILEEGKLIKDYDLENGSIIKLIIK